MNRRKCPYCQSNKTYITQQGVIMSIYKCENCGARFTRLIGQKDCY